MNTTLNMDTELLYCGNHVSGTTDCPDTPPVYYATAYAVKDTVDYDFANRGGKYFYSRTANPNRDCLGELISCLEHGEGTLVCSSGMAAIATTLLGLLKTGDHVLINRAVYGETIALLNDVLSRYGIEASYADFTDLPSVEQGIRSNTKLLYTEVIANPLTVIADIEAIAAIAKRHGLLTVVDSTFTTPCVFRPLDVGADVVIHSLTKYFGGHSDLTGGSITASKELVSRLTTAYLLLGCCLDPNSAWLFGRSARTLAMRVRKQNENAAAVAKALAEDPRVIQVYHPSLPDHPQHVLAQRMFAKGLYGAMISFRVADDVRRVDGFMHRLSIIQYLGTLGGIRTSVTHPATAFQNEFSKEKLREMGLTEGLIRISTGAEDPDDIIGDLSQALDVFSNL